MNTIPEEVKKKIYEIILKDAHDWDDGAWIIPNNSLDEAIETIIKEFSGMKDEGVFNLREQNEKMNKAINLAQAELRSCYTRLGIKRSNILSMLLDILDGLPLKEGDTVSKEEGNEAWNKYLDYKSEGYKVRVQSLGDDDIAKQAYADIGPYQYNPPYDMTGPALKNINKDQVSKEEGKVYEIEEVHNDWLKDYSGSMIFTVYLKDNNYKLIKK